MQRERACEARLRSVNGQEGRAEVEDLTLEPRSQGLDPSVRVCGVQGELWLARPGRHRGH